MSDGTKKHLAAVVEVLHAYFQQLYKENKANVRVNGIITQTGPFKDLAVELSVKIKPGNKYSQTDVSGRWVSADTISNGQASEERKQIHPDTVYAAIAYLMFKKHIPAGSLGYYQMRTKANSETFGQPLASASHNPVYILSNGPNINHWLWTTYEDSKWFKNIKTAWNKGNMKQLFKGTEETKFSAIDSKFYKSVYGIKVNSIDKWMTADIMPNNPVLVYKELKKFIVDWKAIPTTEEAFMGVMF
tara:strand:- start:97 stop:831 length:735 start_codon:yes stop_codon:yes gene_type:complete